MELGEDCAMNDATMRMCILFAITASGLCGEAVKLEKEVVLHGISSVGCRGKGGMVQEILRPRG